jgi:hypothetical protein
VKSRAFGFAEAARFLFRLFSFCSRFLDLQKPCIFVFVHPPLPPNATMAQAATITARVPSAFPLAANLPPVVERELRVAARRDGTYWGRLGAALVALLIAGWSIYGLGTLALTPQVGRDTFRVLAMAGAYMLLN